MIGENPFEVILAIAFLISTVFLYIEVKEYYLTEEERRRTNDMYIYHISILSTKGIIYGIISIVSFITLLLIYLERNGIIFSTGG